MGRSEADRGWWQRNWGWCVGCGCLLPVLGLGALISGGLFLGNQVLSNTGAIEIAMVRLNENPVAVELLGKPIEKRLLGENTTINFNNDRMQARFGVTGPKGDGRLEVEAHKVSDAWVTDRLLLHVDERDEPIDLLEGPAPVEEPEEEEPAEAA